MDQTIVAAEQPPAEPYRWATDLLAERLAERTEVERRLDQLQHAVSSSLGRLDYRVDYSTGAVGIPPDVLAELTEIRDQLSAALDASHST